jgi:hypothetical protein
MISLQKAGRSGGDLDDITLSSTTTSASTQTAPAFLMSSLIAGADVIRFPRTTSAEMRTWGPWQMAATVFLPSNTALTSFRVFSQLLRPDQGFICSKVDLGGIAVLARHDGIALDGPDDHNFGSGLPHPVIGVRELGVLVVVCHQQSHLLSHKFHFYPHLFFSSSVVSQPF